MTDAVRFYLYTKGKVVIFYRAYLSLRDKRYLLKLFINVIRSFHVTFLHLLVVLQHVLSRSIPDKHSHSSAIRKR